MVLFLHQSSASLPLDTSLKETDVEALFNLALELLATTPWERFLPWGRIHTPFFCLKFYRHTTS
jgi:hypothetical protein